jgi:DNA helicase II / ATP-dependent DNA helicase PcrA
MLMTLNENATGTLDEIGDKEHAVTSEYRIFGAPGTGKTTNLSRQVNRAVEKYGVDAVLVTSFSRAAAAELAGRDLPISSNKIGTLHSHCFHALGQPQIAEANVEEWNSENAHLPITPVKKQGRLDGEDSIEDASNLMMKAGDSLLQELNRLRGLMLSSNFWPANVRDFYRKWSRYKQERGLFDFCDLIETCLRDFTTAPQRPSVIFADEAQDLNAMHLQLIRNWGDHTKYFILAGDDDQTIYPFTGASPDAILDPDIPEDHKIILKQSYRVPRAIHKVADRLIHGVTRRQEKLYLPRPALGSVHQLYTGTYKSPEYFILATAMKHLEQGKTVMFLASCSYMLRPLLAVLRKNAIPFHNPYRKANGFWNPLRIGSPLSAANRILSLLIGHPEYGEGRCAWTHRQLMLWTDWLNEDGTLKHGAKAQLQSFAIHDPVPVERLHELFEPKAFRSFQIAHAGGPDAMLQWWRCRVTADVHSRIQFPADVAAKHGAHALIDVPRVIVGTIHSVKGGEADVVYLFPDTSHAADAQYQRSGQPRDAIIRVFYVGATRARETLYICQRDTAMAVALG